MQQMQQRAAAVSVVKRTGPVHLLLRSSQVQLGRVLDKQRDGLPGHTPVSRLDVRSENILELDLRVIEEAISRRHFGTVIASGRDAGRRNASP